MVQRIFKEYLEGRSPKAIAQALNREKIPGPSGSEWGPSTIYGNRERGTGIINNELYVGVLVWNRQRYIKDPDTGKRVSRLNPEAEWIRKDVSELRIIDQALWEQTKETQGEIRKMSQNFRELRRPPYLFSNLLKCGCCGGGFSKVSQTRYGCSSARNKGTCNNRLTIDQKVLEASLLQALHGQLMNPELCDVFCQEYTRHLNDLRKRHNAALAGYQAELTKLSKARDRIVKAVVEGFSTDEMKVELDRIVARRKELETLLDGEEAKPVILHPNMAVHYRNEVMALIAALNDNKNRSEAAKLIRSLVEKIVLTPNASGTGLRVDLHGDLAGILSMATKDGRKAGEQETLIHQVALVANGQRTTRDQVGIGGCGRTFPPVPTEHVGLDGCGGRI
ncbi:MAG: recombinase family protein [Vampirovibrionales bacterium]|nr:recombinase family protein [Vampirovibrionales bacterium]